MRKYLIGILLLILVFANKNVFAKTICIVPEGYSFESLVDPGELETWEVVDFKDHRKSGKFEAVAKGPSPQGGVMLVMVSVIIYRCRTSIDYFAYYVCTGGKKELEIYELIDDTYELADKNRKRAKWLLDNAEKMLKGVPLAKEWRTLGDKARGYVRCK